MDKKKKFPREGARNSNDGLDELARRDVEGHRARSGDGLTQRGGPSTGGDAFPRRPSSGGELIDDNDVEGHARFSPHGPGTGGDAFPRRPSSGGELIDDNDVEGHRRD
jgi:hypothetical protein